MRARTELAVAGAAALLLFVLAYATGRSQRGVDDVDQRASTLLTGRAGARAIADAAERLGVTVVRWRARPSGLAGRVADGATVVLFGAARPISLPERRQLALLATTRPGANLVLAGSPTEAVMRCFGYIVLTSLFDSSQVHPPGGSTDHAAAWVHGHLVAVGESARPAERDDPFTGESGEACPRAIVLATDTLLLSTTGKIAMLRLTVAPHGRSVLLLGDATLVRNRTLRVSSTAPLVLESVLRQRGPLVFDEYHQGFGPGGSMAGVTFDWSRRHPLGWLTWQLLLVALLALVAGAIRFGPVRRSIPRQRRSSLEHVRALAIALAAARGHQTAIGAMVRGLRRRLAAASAPASPRDDWRAWLIALVARAPNARARIHAERLQQLADAPDSETAVLSAANAVEDLWHALRP